MSRILRRKTMATLVSSLAVTVLLNGCGHTGNPSSVTANDPLRVGFIGTTGGLPAGPEGWAQHDGLLLPALRSQGIKNITFTAFPNGPDLNEAMAAGALDVGMLGDTPGIVGHAAGIPTHLINQTAVGTNCWLIVRPDGPKTVEELKGKTVATQKGSYMARYLLGLLALKGLSQEVKFVHLANTDSEAALRRGDIAAYASGSGPLLIAHGFRSIDEAAQHPGLEGSSVTVIRDAYLKTHPEFPAAWNKARTLGIKDIAAHSDQYYQAQATKVKVPFDVYKKLYPSRVYLQEPLTPRGVALLDGTKAFLVQQHLAKHDFQISDWAVPGTFPAQKVAVAKS